MGATERAEAIVSIEHGVSDYENAAEIERMTRAALERLDLPEGFIRPGDRVVLKPNWVKEHDERSPGPGQWAHVVTHPSVIAAVVHWVAPQLQGSGTVFICDAPQTDSSFETLARYCGFAQLEAMWRQRYPGIEIRFADLRQEAWHAVDGVTVRKETLPGDPAGNTHVRLNEASELVGFQGQGRLFGASFDMDETNARHRGTQHDYLLCRTPMDADVFINLPKLKTHKKVGITCALKNLVGINANKNWLPHHTEGDPENGGDQFPAPTRKARQEQAWMGRAKRFLSGRPFLSRCFVPIKKLGRLYFGDTQEVVRSGNWHGNDTCWRMVLDLNKCLYFFGGDGARRERPLRYLAVVDGIVGGEGNGPMAPDPKPCGVILAGRHPAAVDCVAATLMGFDWQRLRLLKGSFGIERLNFVPFTPEGIEVRSSNAGWRGSLDEIEPGFYFRPHFGWVGAIERVQAGFST